MIVDGGINASVLDERLKIMENLLLSHIDQIRREVNPPTMQRCWLVMMWPLIWKQRRLIDSSPLCTSKFFIPYRNNSFAYVEDVTDGGDCDLQQQSVQDKAFS